MPRTLTFLLALATTVAGADREAWQARCERLARDPTVARLYTFTAGRGDVVVNRAAAGDGDLLLVGRSAYGRYRGEPRWPVPAPTEVPRWTVGRWPWKPAVAGGGAPRQAVRSRWYGTSGEPFTVETWLKVDELPERQWVSANILTDGFGWRNGWRLVVQRQHWCRNGRLDFCLGVPTGTVSVWREFPFGVWHHVAVVWDGQAVHLYVDGEGASQATPDPWTAPEQRAAPAQDIDGLSLNGGPPYAIDELVVYSRALDAAEIAATARDFAPTDVVPPPPPVSWHFPAVTGGYFPVGEPITFGVDLPSPDWSVDCAVDGKVQAATFTPPACGLYTLVMAVRDPAGNVTHRREFPFAAVRPPSTGPFILGVGHGFEEQPAARAVGIAWARVVVDWRRVERRKEIYEWEQTDQTVDSATADGLTVLCCVTGSPEWAGGERLPGDLDRYREFLRLLANRYRGRIGAWEIWDCPGGAPRYRFRGSDGAVDYATLVDAAVPVLRREAPGTRIVGLGIEATSPYRASWPGQVRAALTAAPLDTFTYRHAPAVPAPPPDARGNWNVACTYRQRAPYPDVPDDVAWPYPLCSPREAASRQVTQVLLDRAAGADAVFLAEDPETCYPPWNDADGNPSLKGVALAAMQALFGDVPSYPPAREWDELPLRTILVPRPAATPVLVLLPNQPLRLTADFGPGEIHGWDWLGNPVSLPPPDPDGKRSRELDGTPLYLFTAVEPR